MEQKGRTFPVGKRELIFGTVLLAVCLLMANCVIFGGFHLGFAAAYILCILCSGAYLICCGHRPTAYSASLLALSMVTAASFARSDDGFVKLVMLCFLFISTNLGLSLLAGKNRYHTGGIRSVLDAFETLCGLGVGELPASSRGLGAAIRRSGSIGQTGGAVLLGLGIAVPVLLIIVPLLIQADAAFEGMLRYLPEFSLEEIILTVLFGGCLAFVLYTRNAALRYMDVRSAPAKGRKGMSALTVNTLLITVCLVYCAYLVSQLAYFTGGFAGVLPEDYTLAQYARRGFFEMTWLCAINLSIIIFSLSLCKKEVTAPLFTRLLCLFIGIVTLFLVAAASAKMILYIQSFGLTRLRLLTQVVMVFLGIVTALVSVWLFVPRLPYMKAVLVTALLIGAAVSWADVDTQVAKYNVNAYLSGKMETVDVEYLDSLGNGAVPYLAKLAQLSNEYEHRDIADTAEFYLVNRWCAKPEDFRSWNYVNSNAAKILGDPPTNAEDTNP